VQNATQRKLNAIADALADLMDELGADSPALRRAREGLTSAVGVEHRESTKIGRRTQDDRTPAMQIRGGVRGDR
jgi:hypothetical protein